MQVVVSWHKNTVMRQSWALSSDSLLSLSLSSDYIDQIDALSGPVVCTFSCFLMTFHPSSKRLPQFCLWVGSSRLVSCCKTIRMTYSLSLELPTCKQNWSFDRYYDWMIGRPTSSLSFKHFVSIRRINAAALHGCLSDSVPALSFKHWYFLSKEDVSNDRPYDVSEHAFAFTEYKDEVLKLQENKDIHMSLCHPFYLFPDVSASHWSAWIQADSNNPPVEEYCCRGFSPYSCQLKGPSTRVKLNIPRGAQLKKF